MALTTKNQLSIAYKKLVGKAHTHAGFGDENESIGSNVQIDNTTIFGEPITVLTGSTSLFAVTGTVEKVEFQLEAIPSSEYNASAFSGSTNITAGGDGAPTQGTLTSGIHAFKLKLPSNYVVSSSNPSKGSGSFQNNQAVSDTNGKLQIIPARYGSVYLPEVASGSTVIGPLEEENYYLDSFNGILFLQDINRVPTKVTAYLYVGKYLNTAVGDAIASSSAGPDKAVQFKSGSAVSGSERFTFDYNTNTLNLTGTLSASGDVFITGRLTANEYFLQQVTSSVLLTTGSTRFGDTNNDTHVFSGSVDITNGLSVTGTVAADFLSGSGADVFNITASNINGFSDDVRSLFSGLGSVSYNPSNGQISSSALTAAVTQVLPGQNIGVSSPTTGPVVTVSLSSSLINIGDISATGTISASLFTGSRVDVSSLTASNITASNTLRATIISGTNAEFSGNVLIYGSASLAPPSNPSAAYVRYVAAPVDKIEIFPGLRVSGSAAITTEITGGVNVSGSVTASAFSGSGTGLTNIPVSSLSGVVQLANGGTGLSITGDINGKLLIGSGSSLVTGSLIQGQNVTITPNSGSITIAVTGNLVSQVTSGDSNIIIESGSSPTVTASLNTTLTGLSSVTTDAITSNTTAILNGAFFLKNTIVTASYVMVETDSVLLVNTENPITITLPGEVDSGRVIIIKKMVDTINTVTIDGNAIDGESVFELNGPYQSVTLISEGNDWYVT